MDEQATAKAEDAAEAPPHPLEEGLDVYPVRDASEDPKWAIRTVWVWVGMVLFLLLFFVYLIIAGIFYD